MRLTFGRMFIHCLLNVLPFSSIFDCVGGLPVAVAEDYDPIGAHEALGGRMDVSIGSKIGPEARMGGVLSKYEEPVKVGASSLGPFAICLEVDKPEDLPAFFKKLETAVRKFIKKVSDQWPGAVAWS